MHEYATLIYEVQGKEWSSVNVRRQAKKADLVHHLTSTQFCHHSPVISVGIRLIIKFSFVN
jgi:hypothetical protein